jgi:hypothetical protein
MATLLFTALGTALGGPLGGAIGAMIGQRVDSAIIGSPTREGPRLKELGVSTSSYGAALPRHHGRMRVPGTIIWSTDLIEHREKQGGGKGKPSVTAYSYTVSFAVALASRPISAVARIWADGTLLRGAAGDLKTGGSFRMHTGEGDQSPDPLIAAAEGADRTPAFRGLAYAVFEDLDLSDFGNRIPALTFEVIADDTPGLALDGLTAGLIDQADARVALPGLAGISIEGPLGDVLSLLDPLWPMDCDACGDSLIIARERLQSGAMALTEAAVAQGEGDFGSATGFRRSRTPPPVAAPGLLRYYDVDRDYQPGLQRAPGRPPSGQPAALELPAAMAAGDAQRLIGTAARRTRWARESLAWRTCELDPAIAPGAVVTVPGQPGNWRVTEWEWRQSGVELTLIRAAPEIAAPGDPASEAGRANLAPDVTAAATVLAAFELPSDGMGAADTVNLFAAASSASPGWSGAALYVDRGDGDLLPLGSSGRTRCLIGQAVTALPPASPLLFDRTSAFDVELVDPDIALDAATPAQLAMGANRALVGEEIIQFGQAESLGGGRWRLRHLLRGRGGSESRLAGHMAGEVFVLLDGGPVAIDAAPIAGFPSATIAAIGRGDPSAVTAPIACRGSSLRPLSPVHPRHTAHADGSLTLIWTRRARGSWAWQDGVDVPLQEQAEAYEITYAAASDALIRWETAAPALSISAATLSGLAPGGAFHVRQRGSHALSEPLFLFTLT